MSPSSLGLIFQTPLARTASQSAELDQNCGLVASEGERSVYREAAKATSRQTTAPISVPGREAEGYAEAG